jgi:electron transfer flavoprotein beta subunit
MKILVPIKRVPDTDQRIEVHGSGTEIITDDLPYVINPFDAIALEEALCIQENAEAEVEVVAVSIGTDACEKELRSGLAMGADRAVLVETDAVNDSWNVARVLQAVVRREEPDLVLMGKQAVDDDANQAGQMLAALLGWPQATFASKVEMLPDGVRVDRETDAGIETVRVGLPAVITTDLRLNEPRYASLPSIMKARKKQIDNVSLEELGISVTSRVRIVGMEAADSRRTCVFVETVDELLQKLREEAEVI